MKSLKKGFTLVELMVVIVIIGILAALAIPRFLGASNKTKATEFKPVLKQIYTMQEAYRTERDRWGTSAEEIGFDAPKNDGDGGTSRFTYAVVDASASEYVGTATVIAEKIKGLDNAWIETTEGIACVDTNGVQFALAGRFQSLTALDAGCN